MKEQFQDNTYSLLKAMHHTKIAMEYFDSLALSYEYGAKQIMLNYANKSKWIIDNIRHRIPSDVLKEIDSEMKDSLFLDAIEDKIIHFTNSQREELETIINLMSKGELIQIVDSKSNE